MKVTMAELKHISSLARNEALEEAAKVATGQQRIAPICPFDKRAPNYKECFDFREEDPCPVCKQTGHDDGSKCTSNLSGQIAAAIRALKT